MFDNTSGGGLELSLLEAGLTGQSGPVTNRRHTEDSNGRAAAVGSPLMEDALPLHERPEVQPAPEGRRGQLPSLLTVIGFAFLTFNSALALYKSSGDVWATSFVAFSYLDLVLLFYSLRIHEGSCEPTSFWRRRGVGLSVWSLTTLLSVMFCYKVAIVMPLPMAAAIWAMAAAGLLGVFYGFCTP